MMPPTEVLANLRALKEGIDQVLAGDDEQPGVNAAVVAFRDALGVKGGFHTDWGEIAFVPHPAKVEFDGDAVLQHARERYPHEVVEEWEETIPARTEKHAATVRPTLYSTLRKKALIQGDSVVDGETGEVMAFAYVVPEEPATPRFTMTREQKAEAGRMVGRRLEQIAAAVRPELEEGAS